RRRPQFHWIADHEGAGRYRDGRRAIESKYAVRTLDYRRATGAHRDAGCADDDVLPAVCVRQADAHAVTADARVHDLTQGLPVDRKRGGCRLWTGGPRADPASTVMTFGLDGCWTNQEDRRSQRNCCARERTS